MIVRHDLLDLNFYKKSPFTGSDGTMRYRVERIEIPQSEETAIAQLCATVWFGPYAFACTPDEEKTTHTAAFSEQGMTELVDWMNAQNQSDR